MSAKHSLDPPPGERLESIRTRDGSVALQWGILFGGPIVATTVTTLFTLVARVMIFRLLDAPSAGRYALLVALAQFLTPLGNLGQWSLTLREYSKPGAGLFNWPIDSRNELLLGTAPLLLGSLLAGRIYAFTLVESGFIFAASFLNLTVLISAYRLASRRHYSRSNALIRMPGALMIIAPSVAILDPRLARPGFFLAAQLMAFATTSLTSLVSVSRHLPRGSETLSVRQRLGGLAFLPAPFVQLASEDGMTALAGVVLPPSDIAAFAAMVTLFRPFRLARQISSQVLTSEVSRQHRINYKRLVPAWLSFSAGLGIAAVAVVPFASRVLYENRFLGAIPLVPWLALAGTLNLLEALPQSYMVGIGSMSSNAKVALAQVGIILGGFGLGLALTLRFGLLGPAIAATGIHLSRLLVSSYYSWRGARRGF